MAPPPSTALYGWYGKLPTLGDFSTRGLTPDWVQPCDDWLSAGLATSQQLLGADWLETYLTAPLWRFAWAPGVMGPAEHGWWLGVLMPSVDRVGRYFPLLLAAACPSAQLCQHNPTALVEWLERLADLAQQCLEPGLSPEALQEALHAAPPPWVTDPVATAEPVSTDLDPLLDPLAPLGSVARSVALAPELRPDQHYRQQAWAQFLSRTAGHSLWWSGMQTPWPSQLIEWPGLPCEGEFSGLLLGH